MILSGISVVFSLASLLFTQTGFLLSVLCDGYYLPKFTMIGVDDNEDRCSNEMVYITDIIIFGIQCYPFAPSVHHTFFF